MTKNQIGRDGGPTTKRLERKILKRWVQNNSFHPLGPYTRQCHSAVTSEKFEGALNLILLMLRDGRLSDSCTSDICSFPRYGENSIFIYRK